MVGVGYGFLETVLISSTGAFIGVWLFYSFGERLFEWLAKRNANKQKKKKKVFTPTRKWIVRVKNNYGIYGLMGVSAIISVPVTALIASKYFKDEKSTPWWLCLGFVLWSLILTSISWSVKYIANG
jgi:uncharacterized membrane protein